MYQAKWGNKGFLVSPDKIVPMLKLSTGFARKADTNNDTSGQPTTNTRGIELQEIRLETRYLASAGVDPRGQIEDWKAQFGKQYPLYINGKQFGPDLLELDSVDITDIKLDNLGNFLMVDMTVTLLEYIPPTTKVSEKKGATSSTSTKAGAMAAGPSSAEKAAKKVIPQREIKKYKPLKLKPVGGGLLS